MILSRVAIFFEPRWVISYLKTSKRWKAARVRRYYYVWISRLVGSKDAMKDVPIVCNGQAIQLRPVCPKSALNSARQSDALPN